TASVRFGRSGCFRAGGCYQVWLDEARYLNPAVHAQSPHTSIPSELLRCGRLPESKMELHMVVRADELRPPRSVSDSDFTEICGTFKIPLARQPFFRSQLDLLVREFA